MTEPACTISSPRAFGSGELKVYLYMNDKLYTLISELSLSKLCGIKFHNTLTGRLYIVLFWIGPFSPVRNKSWETVQNRSDVFSRLVNKHFHSHLEIKFSRFCKWIAQIHLFCPIKDPGALHFMKGGCCLKPTYKSTTAKHLV